jgi:hypothetical protein
MRRLAPLAAQSSSHRRGEGLSRRSSRASRVASKALTRKHHRSRFNHNVGVVTPGHTQKKQRKRNRSARVMRLAARPAVRVKGRINGGAIRHERCRMWPSANPARLVRRALCA